MMKRKRIILAAASVMAAALTLTACGKKQETMVEETVASTEAQIVETETQSCLLYTSRCIHEQM